MNEYSDVSSCQFSVEIEAFVFSKIAKIAIFRKDARDNWYVS